MEGMSSPEAQELGAVLLREENTSIDHSKASAFIVREEKL